MTKLTITEVLEKLKIAAKKDKKPIEVLSEKDWMVIGKLTETDLKTINPTDYPLIKKLFDDFILIQISKKKVYDKIIRFMNRKRRQNKN